jgi:hypothetical protein
VIDQYPAAIILTIRDGKIISGCEPIADLADVINPDLIDNMVAPLDEWRGEIRVPVAMGLLV